MCYFRLGRPRGLSKSKVVIANLSICDADAGRGLNSTQLHWLGRVHIGTWHFRDKGWTISVHVNFGTNEVEFGSRYMLILPMQLRYIGSTISVHSRYSKSTISVHAWETEISLINRSVTVFFETQCIYIHHWAEMKSNMCKATNGGRPP